MDADKQERMRIAASNYIKPFADADDLADIARRYGFSAVAAALAQMMLTEKMHSETLVRNARKTVQEIEKSEYTLRYLTDNMLNDYDC